MDQIGISVKGLTVRYGNRAVVDRLSFQVRRGELFALLGPNGAGKTTTVEVLEGYRGFAEGEVRVLGLDPRVEGTALKRRVGLMLQDGGLYPSATPIEVLRLFASFYADSYEPTRLLSLVGLEDAARQRYRSLSGGQKQRLSLALALVGRPELVFLDEPTAAMDTRARHATWDIIKSLRADGVTVFLTTHYLDEAERLADTVAIVAAGRLVACGSPGELGSADGSPTVQFEASPGLDVSGLVPLVGARAAAEVRPGEYRVDVEPSPRVLAALAGWLADQDVLLSHLRIGRRSLEEVYLHVTGDEAVLS
ncbi:MAG: ABC transporter ATP-binding protein [Chloroflexota bacterium]